MESRLSAVAQQKKGRPNLRQGARAVESCWRRLTSLFSAPFSRPSCPFSSFELPPQIQRMTASRHATRLDSIYGRRAQESRQFAVKEKNRLSRGGPGVVTLTGQDGQPFAPYTNLDGMVFQAAVRAARRVGQRILVASLLRDPGIQLLHRPALQTIVDVAAGVMSVFGKPFESPLEKSAAHANTINRNVIAQQFLQHRIVVIHIEFGPVHAIRNQENNLAAFAVAILQQLSRGIHRVVQRFGRLALDVRKSSRDVRRVPHCGVAVDRGAVIAGWTRRTSGSLLVEMRALQLGEQFVLVADETLARVEELVKAAYPGFIVEAQAGNNGTKAVPNLLGVLGFQIVVDEHDHGNGNHIRPEGGDSLLDVVFKNAKFVPPKVWDEPSPHVLHRHGDDNLIHRNPDPRLHAALLQGGWRILCRRSAAGAVLRRLRLELSDRRASSSTAAINTVFRRLFI